MTDSMIVWAGAWCLVGWLTGVAFAVCLWWRPISRARHDTGALRLYRMQLEDSDRQLTAALAQANRMADLLAEQAGGNRGRVA